MNFYSPAGNNRSHSIGHKMRIARIKVRADSPGRWQRAYGGKAFLKRCVLSLERKVGKKSNFGFQEVVKFKVVDRWQREPFCQVMIWHMEWKERVNQKIVLKQNVTEMKDFCKNVGFWVFCMWEDSLWSILCLIGSQCNCFIVCVGVMCWYFEVFVMTRANEFWMRWSLLRFDCEMPE